MSQPKQMPLPLEGGTLASLSFPISELQPFLPFDVVEHLNFWSARINSYLDSKGTGLDVKSIE